MGLLNYSLPVQAKNDQLVDAVIAKIRIVSHCLLLWPLLQPLLRSGFILFSFTCHAITGRQLRELTRRVASLRRMFIAELTMNCHFDPATGDVNPS